MVMTKIYGTIGPTSYQENIINHMMENGLSGLRINLSHGNLYTYTEWFNNIHQAEKEKGKKIAILADVQGPEIRTGRINNEPLKHSTNSGNNQHEKCSSADNNNFAKKNTNSDNEIINGNIKIKKDDQVYITTEKKNNSIEKADNIIFIDYPELPDKIDLNQIILIDDGLIELQVEKIKRNLISCKAIRGGMLGERKGVNIPGVKLSLPVLTEKDKKDIKLGIGLGINYIMLPFTRTSEDIDELRDFLDSNGGEKVGIYAKIENQQGIDNLKSFIKNIEGVVIARGDLGVEIGICRVPLVQKELIKLCNEYKKDSIVVTHMLQSMINSPLPTRAEISDIANAVLDGCTGVMLTGETAVGKYPVEAVRIMYETVRETEEWNNA